jgi:hypothetical protein
MKTTGYVAASDRADPLAGWDVVQGSPSTAAAGTLVGVALGYDGQLVEIEAIAAVP